MRKIKFGRHKLAYLEEPLNVGDIIEVTGNHGKKYTLVLCINEDKATKCKSCVFSPNGVSICANLVQAPFLQYEAGVSPCSSLLLGDGKEYKITHCIYYKNLDSVMEDL